jgi:hypothetical protein
MFDFLISYWPWILLGIIAAGSFAGIMRMVWLDGYYTGDMKARREFIEYLSRKVAWTRIELIHAELEHDIARDKLV